MPKFVKENRLTIIQQRRRGALELEAIRVTFWDSAVAAQQGGTQLTAVKNKNKNILIASLRLMATYIQGIASQDLANSTNRTQSPVLVPVVNNVDNSAAAKFIISVAPQSNAVAYQGRAGINGVWMPVVTFTDSSNIVVPGVVPGTRYDLQTCAIGGSNGQSDWSAPVNYMAN